MAQIPDYNLNPLNGVDFNLMQLTVGATTVNPVTTIPISLANLSPWNPNNADRTRTITFAPQTSAMMELVEGPFTMNGSQFSMDTINDTS